MGIRRCSQMPGSDNERRPRPVCCKISVPTVRGRRVLTKRQKRSERRVRGVRRLDHKSSRTHGWTATLRRRSGSCGRFFSDRRHHGRKAAYRAAVTWLRIQEAKFPRLSRLSRARVLRRNNRSGTAGVYRWPADGRDVPTAYWAAQWVVRPNDKPRRRKFSVGRYGEERAKRLAMRARRHGEREIKG